MQKHNQFVSVLLDPRKVGVDGRQVLSGFFSLLRLDHVGHALQRTAPLLLRILVLRRRDLDLQMRRGRRRVLLVVMLVVMRLLIWGWHLLVLLWHLCWGRRVRVGDGH